jgi:hypothetical protein
MKSREEILKEMELSEEDVDRILKDTQAFKDQFGDLLTKLVSDQLDRIPARFKELGIREDERLRFSIEKAYVDSLMCVVLTVASQLGGNLNVSFAEFAKHAIMHLEEEKQRQALVPLKGIIETIEKATTKERAEKNGPDN